MVSSSGSPASTSTSSPKSVRFSTDNRLYSPPPLEFCDSDLESPMMATPPQLPYATLPPMNISPKSSSVRSISPLNNHGGMIQRVLSVGVAHDIEYDVNVDPNIALRHCPVLNQELLNSAATMPPQKELYIVSRYIPWKLRIQPSPNSTYVTVSDVLGGLYCALRLPVTPAEYRDSTSESGNRPKVDQAFERRMAALERVDRAKAREERTKGRRRVDYLGDKLRFLGLSRTESPDEWRLSVGAQ